MKKLILTTILTISSSIPAIHAESTHAGNYEEGDCYLYCHMSGSGEWTAYAVSEDGVHFEDLFGGGPVFDPEEHALIEGGTRDAYICRSHDGKKFLMVTTDMCVAKSHEWWNYGINLYTSDDMLNWESVPFDFRKGPTIFSAPEATPAYTDYSTVRRVWAPQIIWNPGHTWDDGRKGGYMIYYSMLNDINGEDHYDRMYCSYADEGFNTLTQPRLMFDWGYATIDADINYVDSDGLYHMMIKKEGGQPGLFTSACESVDGVYPEPVADDYIDFEGKKKCEGVSAFRIEGEDGWRIGYIEYSSKPKHYRICKADSNMRNFHDPADIIGVESPQHGSFMRITRDEYNRLKQASEEYLLSGKNGKSLN